MNYSITDVPAGTFYVYCIVYNTYYGSYPVSAIPGDYTGSSINAVTVPAQGTVTSNFAVSQMHGATVSGSITIPVVGGGKNYMIILDTDTDYSSGSTAIINGTTTSIIAPITYSIPEVPVGAYYVYFVIYNSSTYSGYYTVPVIGDIQGVSAVVVADSTPVVVDFTALLIQ